MEGDPWSSSRMAGTLGQTRLQTPTTETPSLETSALTPEGGVREHDSLRGLPRGPGRKLAAAKAQPWPVTPTRKNFTLVLGHIVPHPAPDLRPSQRTSRV